MRSERLYPLVRPALPGFYESAVLAELVVIRLDAEGNASVIIEAGSMTYEAAILDFAHYSDEFGPFRRLDEDS